MSLKLTVRGKTYTVEVDSKGNFITHHVDQNGSPHLVMAETLKSLEQKLTTATRVQTAKVAIQLKRLSHKPERGSYANRGYSYRNADGPWEVIVVTVRGVNEHTRQLMVTWPDGTKSDDDETGRYHSSKIYYPLTMADEEILHRRRLIDESEKWLEW